MSKDIGKRFMKKTQYRYLETSDQNKELPQPPLEEPWDENGDIIDLPSPKELQVPDISLRTAIEKRRSLRKYAQKPLTLVELSYLLWCSQGVQKVIPRPVTIRTVPSAGARHAFETYLLINNVADIQPGLYRYLAIDHKLVAVNLEPGIAEKITVACLRQPFVKKSAVTFIWVAVAYRMYWRYGERGYRYLHLDAGHVCQNLYLAAEAVKGGACAIAAFSDEELNGLLGLDGEEQFAIYVATVGKRIFNR